MVPADSRRIPRAPRYSGYRYVFSRFGYRIITFCDAAFQQLLLTVKVQQRGPTTPMMRCHITGLGSSPVARHYWGNHILFSLPLGTKMFQFPRFASTIKVDGSPSDCRVAPFGNPGIKDRLRLPRAFRSLPRPSSPSRATGIRRAPFLAFACPETPCGGTGRIPWYCFARQPHKKMRHRAMS